MREIYVYSHKQHVVTSTKKWAIYLRQWRSNFHRGLVI